MTQKTLLTMRATYLGHVARMTFVQKQLWMGKQALSSCLFSCEVWWARRAASVVRAVPRRHQDRS
ncbi:hypothetical protein SBD_3585 [Streptomyces bottropensis ATCC 25435]|uniref:Uncharacterized protein n=1 Tax=Streptomyces bottropensis ATCC 25435 TaxID=1054862 RepID=M3EXJ1_9ACTN|nr:hypothetical protein SBD_3585 [Streptomyces bottropensis ATCC 25435]